MRIVKNKVAPPFRIAEFDIFKDGISFEGSIIDVGLELEVLTKSGAFIRHGEKMLGQGKEAVRIYLTENPKMTKEILDEIWKAFKAGDMKEKVVGKEEK